jgi:hypothetical protein
LLTGVVLQAQDLGGFAQLTIADRSWSSTDELNLVDLGIGRVDSVHGVHDSFIGFPPTDSRMAEQEERFLMSNVLHRDSGLESLGYSDGDSWESNFFLRLTVGAAVGAGCGVLTAILLQGERTEPWSTTNEEVYDFRGQLGTMALLGAVMGAILFVID